MFEIFFIKENSRNSHIMNNRIFLAARNCLVRNSVSTHAVCSCDVLVCCRFELISMTNVVIFAQRKNYVKQDIGM